MTGLPIQSDNNEPKIVPDVNYGYLSDVQSNICSAVDSYRDIILNDKFVFDGKVWDCSVSSRANINGACTIALLNGGYLPNGFVWRDYNNINWPVTGEYMASMAAACAVFTFACYQAGWTHKGNIMAFKNQSDTLQVLHYDYSHGWPSTNI